ncbi:MAG: hypothetical protein ACLQBB_00645 [Solirubrobacteraceae bacterium]
MRFRITTHSGHDSPPDALSRLQEQLTTQRRNGRFYKVGSEIRVTWGRHESDGWERPERLELERTELLELIEKTCAGVPELQLDWFAVGPLD